MGLGTNHLWLVLRKKRGRGITNNGHYYFPPLTEPLGLPTVVTTFLYSLVHWRSSLFSFSAFFGCATYLITGTGLFAARVLNTACLPFILRADKIFVRMVFILRSILSEVQQREPLSPDRVAHSLP